LTVVQTDILFEAEYLGVADIRTVEKRAQKENGKDWQNSGPEKSA
jgi:hypothetical protein